MSNVRKLLLMLLAFALVFSLASCSLIDKITGKDDDKHKKHEDDDGDCYCDVCDKEMHEDDDDDGVCDFCDEELDEKNPGKNDTELDLILDGEATFQIVLDKTISRNTANEIRDIIWRPLADDFDLDVSFVVEDSEDDYEEDVEILIGQVSSRGEDYEYDKHSLGKEGYAFKIVDTKVLISAGSDDKLVEAVEEFAEYVLMLGEDYLDDVTMTSDDEVEEIQDGYRITALTVGDTDMRGYTLAVDQDNTAMMTAALYFQDTFYDRTGYWFEIVDLNDADDESIVFKNINKIYNSDNSFRILTNDTQLVVECAFDIMCERALMKFINANIVNAPQGEFTFDGVMYKQDISCITYEDFGAKGDGKTNDFQAIWETHNFANLAGLTVKATSGKKYLLESSTFQADGDFKETPHSIEIRTNVVWTGAEFVVDDRTIGLYSGDDRYGEGSSVLFNVLPNFGDESTKFTNKTVFAEIIADGLNPTTKKIDYDFLPDWDGPVMIIPYNNSHKVYRRRGYSSFMGLQTHEVIVLDKDGNIDPTTPVMFYYDNLDYVMVHKLDESTAITIDGGKFTTRSNKTNIFGYDESTGKYKNNAGPTITRNLTVQRSYTTVKNIKHYVTDEMSVLDQFNDEGLLANGETTYAGFFSAKNASYITFTDCTLTGRRCYARPTGTYGSGGGTGGTYDLASNEANAVTFKNCIQSNFWVTVDSNYNFIPATEDTPGAVSSMTAVSINGCSFRPHWGIGGTNYSKNVVYDGSTLSRYDAHAGLYNGKVIDSKVNYFALTGSGEFIIENSDWYYIGETNNFVALRSDYGCTWDGEVTIKNSRAYIPSSEDVTVCGYSYTNWYYGYMVGFPSIEIDNFQVYDLNTKQAAPEGTVVEITNIANNAPDGKSVAQNKAKIHLPISHTFPILPIYDANKDGLVDEAPYDLDGDGIIDAAIDIDGNGLAGETGLDYQKTWDEEKAKGLHEVGIKMTTIPVYYNVNIVKPPEYFKVINNNAKYVYKIPRTDGGGVDNGAWHGVAEDHDGGFFGCTKFYYGTGENDYVVGTKAGANSSIPNFNFFVAN